MGESLLKTGTMATSRDEVPVSGGGMSATCPCCSFLSGGNLFLPRDLLDVSVGDAQPMTARKLEGVSDGGESSFEMMSPREAQGRIRDAAAVRSIDDASGAGRRQGIMLVDTHGHPHLEGQRQAAYKNDVEEDDSTCIVSLTCAVSESDWEDALAYSSRSDRILPAVGVHPWYLADLSSTYLSGLEDLLCRHPNAIVGEIGLCRVAKFVRDYPAGKAAAMELQRRVFREQFRLAAELGRPVTVHCVRQHGVLMSVLKEFREDKRGKMAAERKRRKRRDNSDKGGTEEDSGGGDANRDARGDSFMGSLADAFPPAVGMHSFTGTAHHVGEILKFEESLFADKRSCPVIDGKEECGKAKRPPIFYFGFSHSVNVLMCSSAKSRRQGVEAIRAVPQDRLMAESDVHTSGDVSAGTAGSIAYLAAAIDKPLLEVAELTSSNGLEFLNAAQRRLH